MALSAPVGFGDLFPLAPGAGALLSHTRPSDGFQVGILAVSGLAGAALVEATGPDGQRHGGIGSVAVLEATSGQWTYWIHAGAATHAGGPVLWVLDLPR